jgi:putative ABC transport system substrate-binding protein
LAVKGATSTIPVVALSADPIGAGLLTNLTRPEGNVTGISNMMPEIEPKRIEILRELMPEIRTIGYLASTRDPLAQTFVAEAERAAKTGDLRLAVAFVGGQDEIDGAIRRLKSDGVEALMLQPLFTLTKASAGHIARICLQHGVPAIASLAYFPQADGLASYGPDVDFNARAAAQYVQQLLTGAKVADLPVQQPTTFHLAINQQTARQFGVTVPTSILVRADEVIE